MVVVDFSMATRCLWFPLRILFFFAVPVTGFNVVAEGSSGTERATDISLRCRVTGLTPEDEIVRATWFVIDSSQRFLSEIFSADLTNDRPAFQFSSDWAGRGSYDTSTMANVRLPARFVSRDFAGNYRCQVDSLLSSGFADVKINVFFGPGSSMIISPGGRVERREGQQLSLTCLAQCNPECSYRWYKAGRLVSSSATMIMTSLTRDQAGLYACQVRNEAGRSIKPVDLRVSFPASVLNLNINSEDLETSRSGAMEAYTTNKTVVFTCKVAAWPEPHIEWSNSNAYIDTANRTKVMSTAEVDLELQSSVYEIKSATCRDNGQYTCKAWNSIGDPSFKTGILNMSCSPFETNHSSDCLRDKEITVIKHLHTTLHVNLCFFGNPIPTVTMTLKNKNGLMRTHKGDTSCDFKRNLCNSVIGFNITLPEQYGEYGIKVMNSQGHFEKLYIVSSQQPPLPPFMFIVSNVSETSACFSWKSNFNGGAKQVFSLKVYITSQQTNQDPERHFSIAEDDTNNLSKYSLCVSNLHAETQYHAVLITGNIFGEAHTFRRVTFATIATINSTVLIPSWLSVVQTTTAGDSSEEPTISSGEKIGKLMFKEQSTERQKTRINDNLNVLAAEVQHEREDNRLNLSEFDDERGKQFFRFLDVYFTFNKLTDGKGLKLWQNKNPDISNYSSLAGPFLNYARTPEEGFRFISSPYPTRVSGLENETTSSIKFSTPLGGPTALSSPLSPVMLSIICIGITCVFGVIISFACITVLKRQQIKSHCKRKYRQRDVIRHSRKPTVVNESQLQSQSRDQRNINEILLQRVPSITCVYNENAFFTPQASRRPRLSTPDVNLLRQKETQMDASEAQEKYSLEFSAAHLRGLPFIAVGNLHGSCTSYLDLVEPGIEASPRHCQLNQCLQRDLTFPNTHQLQQSSSSSQRFPYSSVQQTYVKSLSDDDIDISSSYLDLYETLAVRSRSRSPSNIYNPLFFDATSIKSLTDCSERIQSNNERKRDKTVVVRNTDNPNTAISSPALTVINKSQSTVSNANKIHSDSVQCRPKKTQMRLNLTRAPSGQETTTGLVPEGSYELVNVGSRMHLASYMYLPMGSKVNIDCANSENDTLPNDDSENCTLPNDDSEDSDNTYEKPKCTTGLQPHRIPSKLLRSHDNPYDRRILVDSEKYDSATHPDLYSTHPDLYSTHPDLYSSYYQHYIDIDELSRRRNVTKPAYVPQSSNSDISLKDNRKLLYEASGSCISSKENNHEEICESEVYAQEDTLSYINRDSVSTVSTTGTVSTYCNETDLRRSFQCSSGSDFDEPRSRKSSSESDRGIKCSRKFSFDSDSTEHCFEDPLFECSDDAYPDCRKLSEDTKTDRRDSGVSFNCRHDRVCYRNGAMHLHESAKGNLVESSELYKQNPDCQQDLYEEPLVYEHIYAEVSS